MRRCVVILVALLIGTFAASGASAQKTVAGHENLEGQFALSLSGGIVKPNGILGSEPDWNTTSRTSGLDLSYGWRGDADLAFYATSFLAVSLWGGQSELRMRDEVLTTSSGTETFTGLVRGKTRFFGVHARAFLPTERSWTPYAFVGVARCFRKLDFSADMARIAPTSGVLEVTDDAIGFDGGVGFEQPINHWLGLTANARYFYSPALKHDLPWVGRDVPVDNWDFWSVSVGLTYHAPMRPGAASR
jgi:hypothetical protein